ncbi:hypothetical protein ACFTXM_15160 [Streptomyces sp. NPDC056930]|uniref:hypothetical protein n=1 Tax=Streptomyces sp. NPDC056930 TaxID=3345967 RepID=UPI00363952F2
MLFSELGNKIATKTGHVSLRTHPWPWTTALRQENERRAQRLFNLPDDWDLPDAG